MERSWHKGCGKGGNVEKEVKGGSNYTTRVELEQSSKFNKMQGQ
jgi:hypothetical protein